MATQKQSIQQMRMAAQRAIMEYVHAENEYNNLQEECDYTSESRFEFYHKMEEQRNVMTKCRRTAYDVVVKIAALFSIDTKCRPGDMNSIRREYITLCNMLTHTFAFMAKMGYTHSCAY